MATKIRIEGMKHGELDFEIQRGAKFVLFQYCISVIQSVYNNSRGGKDVTQAVVNSLRTQSAPAQAASPIPSAS